MTTTLRQNDSINLTTGVVTRSELPMVTFHRERLAENQLPALAWFLRNQMFVGRSAQ